MLFLCLGLMSKALLVTWPCLFLLLDHWPLGRMSFDGLETRPWFKLRQRLWPLVMEKLPLLVPVFLISANTLAAQRYWDAVISVGTIDLKTRIANAMVSYVEYMAKAIWPVNLSVFYPYRNPETILWPAVGAFLLLVLLTSLALAMAKKVRYFPVGWFWFLGTLVPMIGLVQVGDQAMADRYMYVPLIGLGIVAIWGMADLLNHFCKAAWIAGGIAVMVTVALGAATHRQVGHWENSLTLFQHAVAINPNNSLAHNNLGAAYAQQGDLKKAERHYRRSLALNPLNADAANNLAVRLSDFGQFDEAERLYRRAIRIDPKWVSYRYNYGVLLFRVGRIEEAIEQFSEALTLDPSYAKAYNYIGTALVRQGKPKQAIAFFKRAIELDATFAPARNNLERLLQAEQGQPRVLPSLKDIRP
jgi:tetratricopeptide (TPR) repeat protein